MSNIVQKITKKTLLLTLVIFTFMSFGLGLIKSSSVSYAACTLKFSSSFTIYDDGGVNVVQSGKPSSVRSSDTSVARVSSSGYVSGVKAGKCTITIDGKKLTCTVKSSYKPVTSLNVSTQKKKLEVRANNSGDSFTLNASVNSDATDQGVTFDVKCEPAGRAVIDYIAIGNEMEIMAKAPGKATITVTSDGTDSNGNHKTKEVLVLVIPKPIKKIVFEKDYENTKKDNTLLIREDTSKNGRVTVKAVIEPKDAYYQTVTWSLSNESVVSRHNETGKQITLIAKAPGSTTLVAKAGEDISGICSVKQQKMNVKVENEKLDTISSSKGDKITIGEGQSTGFGTIVYHPEFAVLTEKDKKITYSTGNKNVATIDQDGTITGVSAGKNGRSTHVQAKTASGKIAKVLVEVTPEIQEIMPDSITLDQTAFELMINESKTINATIEPADTTNKNIVWTTSNSKVATVSGGVVKGISAGQAVIKASVGMGAFRKEASCTVDVKSETIDLPISNVTALNITTKRVELETIGSSATVTANVNPKNTLVVWSVDKPAVLTIRPSGSNKVSITARKNGFAVLTASAGDKTDSITVKCGTGGTDEDPDNVLVLSPNVLILEKGGTKEVTASGLTPDALVDFGKKASWSIDDSTVASIKSGVKNTSRYVQANEIGNAKLTVSYNGKSASCNITVVEKEGSVVRYVNGIEKRVGQGLSFSEVFLTAPSSMNGYTWDAPTALVSGTGASRECIKDGIGYVNVYYNGDQKAHIPFTVLPKSLISLSANTSGLKPGSEVAVTATLGKGLNVKDLVWSVDDGLIMISKNTSGVKSVKVKIPEDGWDNEDIGACGGTVTAKCGNETATIVISAQKPDATKFTGLKYSANVIQIGGESIYPIPQWSPANSIVASNINYKYSTKYSKCTLGEDGTLSLKAGAKEGDTITVECSAYRKTTKLGKEVTTKVGDTHKCTITVIEKVTEPKNFSFTRYRKSGVLKVEKEIGDSKVYWVPQLSTGGEYDLLNGSTSLKGYVDEQHNILKYNVAIKVYDVTRKQKSFTKYVGQSVSLSDVVNIPQASASANSDIASWALYNKNATSGTNGTTRLVFGDTGKGSIEVRFGGKVVDTGLNASITILNPIDQFTFDSKGSKTLDYTIKDGVLTADTYKISNLICKFKDGVSSSDFSVNYSLDKSDIAEFIPGVGVKPTGKGNGSVKLSAKVVENSTKAELDSTSVTLTINGKNEDEVIDYKILGTIYVRNGGTSTIPSGGVKDTKWKSLDTTVAKISKGVKYVADGNTTIVNKSKQAFSIVCFTPAKSGSIELTEGESKEITLDGYDGKVIYIGSNDSYYTISGKTITAKDNITPSKGKTYKTIEAPIYFKSNEKQEKPKEIGTFSIKINKK